MPIGLVDTIPISDCAAYLRFYYCIVSDFCTGCFDIYESSICVALEVLLED